MSAPFIACLISHSSPVALSLPSSSAGTSVSLGLLSMLKIFLVWFINYSLSIDFEGYVHVWQHINNKFFLMYHVYCWLWNITHVAVLSFFLMCMLLCLGIYDCLTFVLSHFHGNVKPAEVHKEFCWALVIKKGRRNGEIYLNFPLSYNVTNELQRNIYDSSCCREKFGRINLKAMFMYR